MEEVTGNMQSYIPEDMKGEKSFFANVICGGKGGWGRIPPIPLLREFNYHRTKRTDKKGGARAEGVALSSAVCFPG